MYQNLIGPFSTNQKREMANEEDRLTLNNITVSSKQFPIANRGRSSLVFDVMNITPISVLFRVYVTERSTVWCNVSSGSISFDFNSIRLTEPGKNMEPRSSHIFIGIFSKTVYRIYIDMFWCIFKR